MMMMMGRKQPECSAEIAVTSGKSQVSVRAK
jgi:hypothetical protein